MSKEECEVFSTNYSLNKDYAVDLYFLGGAAIVGSIVLALIGMDLRYSDLAL